MAALSRKCRKGCTEKLCSHKAKRFDIPAVEAGQHGRWQTPVDPQQLERQAEDMSPATAERISQLASKLLDFGLEEWEVSVLISKDVGLLTFEEIQEDGGFVSVSAVKRIYTMARTKAIKAYTKEFKNA